MSKKVDTITCSNCEKILCAVGYVENDNSLSVVCNCPYCGDSSFPLTIKSDKFLPKLPKDLSMIDIDFNLEKRKVRIHVNKL